MTDEAAEATDGEPPEDTRGESFGHWLARPQTMIGLSAIVLSICGLFVSIYEASLTRRAQRASVWPNVEVGPSFSIDAETGAGDCRFRVRNTGIGPAQIEVARLVHRGETKENWIDLIESLGLDPDAVSWNQSLISGRVLPGGSSDDQIFSIRSDGGDDEEEVVRRLTKELLGGRLDVELCYCSVYGDCWIGSMQEFVARFRGAEEVPSRRWVESCSGLERSSI